MNPKLQIVDLAYNQGACLHFRTQFQHIEEAVEAVQLIGQYNEFNPDKVARFLRVLPPANTVVEVGREYSPVIYINCRQDAMERLAREHQLDYDEIGTEGIWCRLW